MLVEKEVADELRDRTDLIQLLDASADYLASRDKDASSQTRARWKLWTGPTGPLIGLQLDGEGCVIAEHLTPAQLDPPDIRRMRLNELWTDLSMERARVGMKRVNELIAQYQREQHGDQN